MKKAMMLGALAVTSAAQAVDFKAGDWNLSVGGMVNAYYTQVSCSGDGNGNAVGGLALAGKALGCGGENNRTTIGNGLLPNGLVTSATSRQGDYDVKALIGMYNATATDSAISANSGVDGYYGQIAYSAPKSASGIGFDVALVSPVADTPIVAAPVYSSKSSPQVQAQLSYVAKDAAAGFKTWLGAKSQQFEAIAAGAEDFTMTGVELGASYQQGAVGVIANVQGGKGLGILSDADQGDVRTRAAPHAGRVLHVDQRHYADGRSGPNPLQGF